MVGTDGEQAGEPGSLQHNGESWIRLVNTRKTIQRPEGPESQPSTGSNSPHYSVDKLTGKHSSVPDMTASNLHKAGEDEPTARIRDLDALPDPSEYVELSAKPRRTSRLSNFRLAIQWYSSKVPDDQYASKTAPNRRDEATAIAEELEAVLDTDKPNPELYGLLKVILSFRDLRLAKMNTFQEATKKLEELEVRYLKAKEKLARREKDIDFFRRTFHRSGVRRVEAAVSNFFQEWLTKLEPSLERKSKKVEAAMARLLSLQKTHTELQDHISAIEESEIAFIHHTCKNFIGNDPSAALKGTGSTSNLEDVLRDMLSSGVVHASAEHPSTKKKGPTMDSSNKGELRSPLNSSRSPDPEVFHASPEQSNADKAMALSGPKSPSLERQVNRQQDRAEEPLSDTATASMNTSLSSQNGLSEVSSQTSITSDQTRTVSNADTQIFVAGLAQRIARSCARLYDSHIRSCAGSQGGSRGPAGQDSDAGASTKQAPFPSNPATIRPSSRKRRKEDDSDDEDNDDKGEEPPAKKINQGSPEQKKLWACPYTKFDPIRYSQHNQSNELKYRKCPGAMLRDISKLKQHLRRTHQEPAQYCGRCYQEFGSRTELRKHNSMQVRCTEQPAKYQEMMTEEQYEQIFKNVSNTEASWYWIYGILFEGAPKPASPYVSMCNTSEITAFNHFFRVIGPRHFLDFLDERLRNNPQTLQFNVPLPAIIEETFETAFPEFLDRLRTLGGGPRDPEGDDLPGPVESSYMVHPNPDLIALRTTAEFSGRTYSAYELGMASDAVNWVSSPNMVQQNFTAFADDQAAEFGLADWVFLGENLVARNDGTDAGDKESGDLSFDLI